MLLKIPANAFIFFLGKPSLDITICSNSLLPAFLTAFQDSPEGERRGQESKPTRAIASLHGRAAGPIQLTSRMTSVADVPPHCLFQGFFLISSVFPSQISSPIWFVGQAQSHAGQPAGELAAPPQLSAPLQVHSWGWCCHLIKMLHLYSNKKSYLPSGFPLVLPLLSVHGGLTQLRWEAGNSLGRKISSYPMGIPHLSQIQPLAASFEGSGQKTLISGLWCWHKCFWLLHTLWPGTEIASRNLNMQEMWST